MLILRFTSVGLAVLVFGMGIVLADPPNQWPETGQPAGPCAVDIDGEGRPVDGTSDRRIEYAYDADGRLTSMREVDAFTETILIERVYTYSSSDHTIAEIVDYSADGYCDHQFTHVYEDGDLISHSTADLSCDGSLDYVQHWTYDEHANLIRHETQNPDYNTTVERILYRYDSAGRVIEEEYDRVQDDHAESAVDGVVDRRVNFNFDEEGRMIEMLDDNQADGTVELRKSYRYDEAGVLVGIDFEQDMTIGTYTLEYDEAGNLAREIQTNELNTIVSIKSYSYECSPGESDPNPGRR